MLLLNKGRIVLFHLQPTGSPPAPCKATALPGQEQCASDGMGALGTKSQLVRARPDLGRGLGRTGSGRGASPSTILRADDVIDAFAAKDMPTGLDQG